MGWFSDDSDQAGAYDQVVNAPHKAELSHELIAGAASYEAAKAYERHCAANGQPASHSEAKELVAGFAGAFVDRMAESKGLDFIDREKAKRQAQAQYSDNLSQDYSGQY
ncbi:hypothetical protein BKA93DRAFT_745912 [Sparassis latifolia]|uniref:CipC protein n=1 Tax=Sparassis crispa TaxID=139825 RepID=A0A401GBJ7_9APHY|nr:hypothetical protein SCP_0207480 [Sparassis crispa]GBE79548.1 hypothetical protein SCP_0207480 [Sparassis crispa]